MDRKRSFHAEKRAQAKSLRPVFQGSQEVGQAETGSVCCTVEFRLFYSNDRVKGRVLERRVVIKFVLTKLILTVV